MARRFIPIVALLIGATSCSTSLFKVKPVTESPPIPTAARSADAGGVTVRVAPLLTDEDQDLFEANLPVSGVLPVRLELAFQSGLPVETKRARFRLRDSENREWKLLKPKDAISRFMKRTASLFITQIAEESDRSLARTRSISSCRCLPKIRNDEVFSSSRPLTKAQ